MMNGVTTRTLRGLLALFAGLALMLCSNATAQTIIEPGPPGTLNNAILGDTTATGERNECHYILRRDAIYIYNQKIDLLDDCYWIVEAEEGDGARPIIKPAALPGGEESPRQFHLFANTTFELRGVHLDGYDTSLPEPGRPSDNAQVRLSADSARVIIDDVRFDRNRQAAMRSDNAHTRIFIYNSQYSNVYDAARWDQGYVIDTRGNEIDTVVFVNNTFWNNTGFHTRQATDAKIHYYKMDHNTWVNLPGIVSGSGLTDTLRTEEPGEQDVGVIELAQADYAVFRNNLIVNAGWIGTDARDVFVPRYIVDVDSAIVNVDSVTFEERAPLGVDIRNNVYSFDESIASVYPDTVRLYTADEVYDPTLDLFAEAQGTTATLIATDIELADAPEPDANFLTSFYEFAIGARDVEPMVLARDTRSPGGEGTIDFSYPTTSVAYTAAVDGLPAGDLNWFGMAADYVSGPDEFATLSPTPNERGRDLPSAFRLSGNYPNPFNPSTFIQFDLATAASVSVEVFDVVGRKVRVLASQPFQPGQNQRILFDAAGLPSGLYLYRVTAESFGDRLVQTGRMTLLK